MKTTDYVDLLWGTFGLAGKATMVDVRVTDLTLGASVYHDTVTTDQGLAAKLFSAGNFTLAYRVSLGPAGVGCSDHKYLVAGTLTWSNGQAFIDQHTVDGVTDGQVCGSSGTCQSGWHWDPTARKCVEDITTGGGGPGAPPTFPDPPPSNDFNPVDWLSWLAKVLYVAAVAFVNFLLDPWKKIGEAIWSALPDWIQTPITKAQAWLDTTSGLLAWFNKDRAAQVKDVESLGLGIINDFGLKWLGLEVNDKPPYLQLVSPSLSKKPLLEALGSQLAQAVGLSSPEQISSMVDLIIKETGSDPSTVKNQLTTAFTDFLGPLTQPLDDAITQVVAAEAGLKGDQAFTIAASVSVAGVSAFILAWLLDQGVELGTLGVSKATGKGIRSVLTTIGLSKWTREFLSAPLAYGVQPWLGRFYDQLFRSHIFERDLVDLIYLRHPDQKPLWLQHYRWYGFPEAYINQVDEELRSYPQGQILDRMRWWGKVTPETWRDVYSKNRWRSEFIDAWEGSFWSTPRANLMARLLDVVPTAETTIRTWLTRQGFQASDVDTLISAFYELAYKNEVTALITETMQDYVDGWISVDTLDTNLTALGRPRTEIDFNKARAELKADREDRDRLVKLYQSKLTKGALSRDDTIKALQGLGLQPDKIDVVIQEAELAAKDSTPKTFTEATLRRLYLHNTIDTETFLSRLIAAGWDPQDAQDDVTDADNQRIVDEQTKMITAALADFDSGYSSLEVATQRLLGLNLTQAEADLRVSTTWDAHIRKYKDALVKIYTDDFAKDKADEPTFRQLLEAIPLETWRIEEIVYTEIQRKVPVQSLGG